MPVTRFPHGIGVGGSYDGTESSQNTVSFYSDETTVVAQVGFNNTTMTITAANNATQTISFAKAANMTGANAALNMTVVSSANNTTVYGFNASSDWATVQTLINNLRTRVGELESIFKGMGILAS